METTRHKQYQLVTAAGAFVITLIFLILSYNLNPEARQGSDIHTLFFSPRRLWLIVPPLLMLIAAFISFHIKKNTRVIPLLLIMLECGWILLSFAVDVPMRAASWAAYLYGILPLKAASVVLWMYVAALSFYLVFIPYGKRNVLLCLSGFSVVLNAGIFVLAFAKIAGIYGTVTATACSVLFLSILIQQSAFIAYAYECTDDTVLHVFSFIGNILLTLFDLLFVSDDVDDSDEDFEYLINNSVFGPPFCYAGEDTKDETEAFGLVICNKERLENVLRSRITEVTYRCEGNLLFEDCAKVTFKLDYNEDKVSVRCLLNRPFSHYEFKRVIEIKKSLKDYFDFFGINGCISITPVEDCNTMNDAVGIMTAETEVSEWSIANESYLPVINYMLLFDRMAF